MKTRNTAFFLFSIVAASLLAYSCSKSSSKPKTTTTSNFWYGSIYGSGNVIGPGNAILLRNDGTMREYANDYYSTATMMSAADTGGALIKIDGTYITKTANGEDSVITSWYQPTGSANYHTQGSISGNTMTGNIVDTTNGGSTIATFKFTNGN